MVKNPKFGQWMSTDQLLMGWLYSSITPDIAMRVMGTTNSKELWTAIEESYRVHNRSRIIFFIGEMQKLRKGTMNIEQYLNKVKLLADNLEIAGKTVAHTDLVTQVLAGLDEDYTPIVVQINGRDYISWGELQSTLMTYESRLEHLNSLRSDIVEININQTSANFSQRSASNYHGSRFSRPNSGGRFTSFDSSRGGRRGRNRGGSFYCGNDRPLICQVCGKKVTKPTYATIDMMTNTLVLLQTIGSILTPHLQPW